jgi:hypothetical protein
LDSRGGWQAECRACGVCDHHIDFAGQQRTERLHIVEFAGSFRQHRFLLFTSEEQPDPGRVSKNSKIIRGPDGGFFVRGNEEKLAGETFVQGDSQERTE